MTGSEKPKGLEISEETMFHDLSVKAQRIAWAMLALLLAAALLGVFGAGGLLSRTHARLPDGTLDVQYDRFVRRGAPSTLHVRVNKTRGDAGEIRLRLSRHYMESMRVDWITPIPLRVEAGDQYLTYIFAAERGARAALLFNVQPQKPGRQRLDVVLEPGHALSLTQLVYP